MRVRPIFRCSILALIFSVVIGIFASHAPTAKAVWISPSGEICIPNIEIYDIYILMVNTNTANSNRKGLKVAHQRLTRRFIQNMTRVGSLASVVLSLNAA